MTVEEWLGDNELGIDIWYKKYQHNGETFDEWLDRVSNHEDRIKQLILDKKFLFGGRILASRGVTDTKVTYSNCYVVAPPEDNIESIFDSMSKLARTFSYGGGCGIDIGKLRPKDAPVNNAAKKSSGSVSFMDLYSMTTSTISQQGRRGALMISIPVSHPDVEDFIGIKNDLSKVTSANISVRVDDKFMAAVINDQDYLLHFTVEETGEEIAKTVRAKELFHKLCENNWDYAEPGILFWDEITNRNLLARDKSFSYAGTNPCAEEPLPAGGSCLLGAINLSSFVKKSFTKEAYFDAEGFQETVHIAVNALNDVLDEGLPLHPLLEQRMSVRDWRQIGLGIMGLADCLIRLGMVYGSDEANKFCDTIAHVMFASAVMESDARGAVYGAYPKFNKEAVNASPMLADAKLQVEHLNNSQLLTIAPTGSISNMLGVSGGIEPIFAYSYTRKTESLHGKKDAVYYKVYTPVVKEYMDEHNITDVEDLPEQFVTSADIAPKNRIECQSTWQKWIDASISSTINLPYEATVDDVVDIYTYAWQKGLKGVTVYRAGCSRSGVLVSDKEKKREEDTAQDNEQVDTPVLKRGDIIDCSDDLIGKKRKLTSGCGSLHCLGYFDPVSGDLQEVYLTKGSTGGCNNFMIGLSRMISLAARAGVDIYTIVDQLDSTGACPSYRARTVTKHDTSKGSCCPMAVGKALLEMWKEVRDELGLDDEPKGVATPKKIAKAVKRTEEYVEHAVVDAKKPNAMPLKEAIEMTKEYKKPVAVVTGRGVFVNQDVKKSVALCPECGEPLRFEGGCNSCPNCGYSKCN